MTKTYDDALIAQDLGDLPFLEMIIGPNHLRAICPGCGCLRLAAVMVDVRRLPSEITDGHAFACDGCLSRWYIEERPSADGLAFTEARYLEMIGAPSAEVAHLHKVAAKRAERYADSAGRNAARHGARHASLTAAAKQAREAGQ